MGALGPRIARLLESRSVEPIEADDRAILGYWEKARRAMIDAGLEGASREGAFERAYQAAFLIATAVLHAHGYRVRGGPSGHHYVVFYALGELGGEACARLADELNDLRAVRHEALYEAVTMTTAEDVERMRSASVSLRDLAHEIISSARPELRERLRRTG